MKVGIVGAGQLARMLALAGYPLGMQFQTLDPAPDACAGQVAPLLQGDYHDTQRLAALAAWADVVTFDFENVPADALQTLQGAVAVYPPTAALSIAQDRLLEKNLFIALGIPTPAFAQVDNLAELNAAIATIGLPAVLKTRRLGYDGKGQVVLHSIQNIEPAWRALGAVPLIVESFVSFEREVSILAVRGRNGERAYYPLVDNYHHHGILRRSRVPCDLAALETQARDYADRLLEHLHYVGVLAIEFFVKNGALLANEMAPRVHNSGHWSIEGAVTSQFENHLRAILGLPLGATNAYGYTVMLNALGAMPNREAVLKIPYAHYHDYGKQARPGRKVGHITVQAPQPELLQASLQRLLPLLGLA